ncbi:MAG TPA: hypothetical protein VGO40_01625 [Longimicrobium sp.]|jgi:hypothetical protein|nr:hypothetical protein [Longimicrobium sp.]
MPRISSLAVASAAALLLAACSDAGQPTAARPTDPALQDGQPHLGVVGLRSAPQRPLFDGNGNAGGVGAAATSTGISYHGGPVLQAQTRVAAVYWAASTIYAGGPAAGSTGIGASDGSNVGWVMNHLGGSPYFNINTTYTNAAGTAISNVVAYTQFWANNSYGVPTGTKRVTDTQILAMLQYAFNNGKLTYDAGTLYNVFTAGSVNLGGGFGTQYCAYHSWGNVTVAGVTRSVLYSAMPYDYAKAAACSNGTKSPNNDPAADAEVSVLTHEIEETTTDMNGNAWYDSVGNENADKCAWNFGTTYTTANGGVANVNLGGRDFLIQQNWINAGTGGCRMSW